MSIKINKGAKSNLVIGISEYEERTNLDIRTWVTTKDGKEVPTKKGITLQTPEQVDALIAALQKTKGQLKNVSNSTTEPKPAVKAKPAPAPKPEKVLRPKSDFKPVETDLMEELNDIM